LGALDASAFVDFFRSAGEAIGDYFGPGHVAIAFDDGVGFSGGKGFFGKEGGVNAAVDDPCSAGAGHAADGVSAESVAGVDADADDVSGVDALGSDLLEGFIDEDWVACAARGGGSEDEEPSRGDYGRAKGIVAGVDQVDTHPNLLSSYEYRSFRECLRRKRVPEQSLGGSPVAWSLSDSQDHDTWAM
jgi:hypothetical protein